MFAEYRKAHDLMSADLIVQGWQRAVENAERNLAMLREGLAQAEMPHRETMALWRERIIETVLAEGHDVILFGVEAKYSKGRRSTAWKSVAGELSPPVELIEKYTTVGEPSVTVQILVEAK